MGVGCHVREGGVIESDRWGGAESSRGSGVSNKEWDVSNSEVVGGHVGSVIVDEDSPSDDEVEESIDGDGSERSEVDVEGSGPVEAAALIGQRFENWNVLTSELDEGGNLVVEFVGRIDVSSHGESEWRFFVV